MTAVKRLRISGFRGILAPLELDFANGSSLRSMVLYGRNGTGKSSITDAWEWFHTEAISHLGREGAGPAAYPHRSATGGQSYVEVEFADAALGVARLEYDHKKITKPKSTGPLHLFHERTPHPCHVRFADLTRFVYLSKAERYDLLAQLMGFEPQVGYQKTLRRVQRELRGKRDSAAAEVDHASAQLRVLLGISEVSSETVTSAALDTLARHSIAVDPSWDGARAGVAELKVRVERDPNASRLADLKDVGSKLKVCRLSSELFSALDTHLQLIRPFKDEEDTLKRILLIGLYERGAEVLATGDHNDQCPLCGQAVAGDLREHVGSELAKLRKLKEAYDSVEVARKKACQLVGSAIPDLQPLRDAAEKLQDEAVFGALGAAIGSLTVLQRLCQGLSGYLNEHSEQIDAARVSAIREGVDSLRREAAAYCGEHGRVLDTLAARVRELQADSARALLVEDYQRVARAITEWEALRLRLRRLHALQAVEGHFEAVVEGYVEASLKDVASRFKEISANVAKYFGMLEQQTAGIEQPVLRVLEDQDRSVVLEVLFHGQATSPAYKYLSESQLNSFGLAVFLASAQRFNPAFKFLILDDVVNSLDGYKRPQLISVLKQHFADYQILLLTHDSVWRDRVYRELPTWRRVHFRRFDFGVGPLHGEGKASLEEVQDYIHDDKAKTAGQVLGPYMEEVLQDVCESFEVEIKYNRRNEYTLDPLFDRLRIRLQSKLGANHALVVLLNDFRSELGFRNLCAHFKDPDIDLTPEEMQIVLDKWIVIEKQLRCQVDACRETLRWSEPNFRCACGATQLLKV